MKKIPWKAICLGCLVASVLIVGRCIVTVGKANYYGQNWEQKLVEDPWFFVGIVAAVIGLVSAIVWFVQNKSSRIEA